MDWNNIHPDFRFNGIAITKEDIAELSYSLIKEGEVFEKEIGNFLQQWIDDKDIIVVNTSGSTGTPKSITLKKEHMVNSAMATGGYLSLKPTNTALLCMSANFIAGKMMLVRAIVLGLHITAVAASSNPLQGLTQKFNFCAMVPMQLQNSLDKLGAVKTIIIGGAPMSNTLKEEVQTIETQVFETYGMTETITHIALKRINNSSQNHFNALPGVKLSIDKRECLVINAPKISDSSVVTNDIVELHSETEFSWLGRYDSIINSGGIKLHPEQLEAKLYKIINSIFFVSGLSDIILGTKLILVVETNVDVSGLLQQIKESGLFKSHEIPKEIYGISKFERTENGKIQRVKTLETLQK